MTRRGISVIVLCLALPFSAFAQGTERYLPSGSQIVLQVDAHQKTKTAYDKTAMGQMMQGDTGKFLRAFYKWALESGEAVADQHQMPSKEDIALIKDALKILEKLHDEGLALGIEVNSAWPPQARLVVVLPKVGTGPTNLAKLLGDLRAKAQNAGGPVEIKDEKIAGRAVTTIEVPMVNLAWWAQGDDFLLTIGTEPVANYIKSIDDGKTGLAKNNTYKKLLDLGAFPTRSRAYVDVPSLVKLADNHSVEAGRVVDELGLKGMGPVLSISGYDGLALRTLTEIETVGPRKGFASWMSEKKITLADLPPMPSDLTTFSAGNANAGQMYGTFLDLGEKIGTIYAPDQVDNIKAAIKGFEGLIGVDLRNDLFGSFDNFYVQYTSPSEGFLGMGGATLFKIKDEAKLKKAINSLIAVVPQIPGAGESGFKRRNYRGAEILEFHINTPGNYNVMSFTTYKGYFAFANYPQPIQGFILRMDGVLPSWKADERLAKALGAFPKEFTGVSFTDPRPGVETVIAALPALITVANGFTSMVPGLTPFDIGQIPHAQEATRHLFPNVSVSTDDGKKVRTEQRMSVGW